MLSPDLSELNVMLSELTEMALISPDQLELDVMSSELNEMGVR